jgi:23S rRNA pseudouridine955/2504/2580 synthase
VRQLQVGEQGNGQRLDNFLLRECSGVPKTRLYKAIRRGEVRVNKGRARPATRLNAGDTVRLPPFSVAERLRPVAPPGWQERLAQAIVHEDADLLVVDKPSGLAVHGGSGLQFGLIETLRAMRPEDRFLELVHRLDRETSGLLLIARRPAALRALHELLRREGGIRKHYLALVLGRWPRHLRSVEAPLRRSERASGERIVRVARDGKPSVTEFRVQRATPGVSLVEAYPLTGRTHQIRVHAQHAGHPVLGDEKYGNESAAARTGSLGLRRLFLHAAGLSFRLGDRQYHLEAPLDAELQAVLERAFRSSRADPGPGRATSRRRQSTADPREQ